MQARPHRPLRRRLALLVLPALLAACGGGGDDGGAPAADCSVAGQKAWLSTYMDDWYFWYQISPRPAAAAFPDVASYFEALLYTGTSATFPADRWSGSQTTESFNRFFGDGESLGYGLSVAGLELDGDPQRPLFVRHVEPLSPAARQGVGRGDQILALNGRSAAELIAADDFSALSTQQPGSTLTLRLRRQGVDRTVTLSAAVFDLTPVSGATVVTTAGGRRLGYVAVKDMISQAQTPLDTAFTRFRIEGVQDLVLDLRYNGGGLVSTGATLASYVAGVRGRNQTYASLLYNDKRSSSNTSFRFSEPTVALGLQRVFVLMGRRTCSASEQLINGLRGVDVEVVAIGEASCGKPVGFLPASSCGRTYSVVNFESVNQRNEGRYFDGFAPTCPVAEDFTAAQGSGADPLMAAAQAFVGSGSCPVAAAAPATGVARALGLKPARPPARVLDEGDASPGMVPR